jgi:hypothetical protein
MLVVQLEGESHSLSHCGAGEHSRRARNSLVCNMTRLGVEPRTYGLKVRCSNQLSYRVNLLLARQLPQPGTAARRGAMTFSMPFRTVFPPATIFSRASSTICPMFAFP